MVLLVQYKLNSVYVFQLLGPFQDYLILLLVFYISNPGIILYSSCSFLLHKLPGSSHSAGAKEAVSHATSIWANQR